MSGFCGLGEALLNSSWECGRIRPSLISAPTTPPPQQWGGAAAAELEASGVALPVFRAAPMAFGSPGAAVLGRLRGAVGADYPGSISSGLPHPTAWMSAFWL